MKKHIVRTGIAFTLIVIMMLPAAWAQSEGFTIKGEITFRKTGTIYLHVLNEEQFGKDDDNEEADSFESVSSITIEIDEQAQEQQKVAFEFTNILPGTYVIQGYQDVNGNGDLDEGTFGPKEPWGMSMLSKKPRLRGPKFDEVKFEVTQEITDMHIIIQ
jgi:uncharacterized protein (DUF2141 family)